MYDPPPFRSLIPGPPPTDEQMAEAFAHAERLITGRRWPLAAIPVLFDSTVSVIDPNPDGTATLTYRAGQTHRPIRCFNTPNGIEVEIGAEVCQ